MSRFWLGFGSATVLYAAGGLVYVGVFANEEPADSGDGWPRPKPTTRTPLQRKKPRAGANLDREAKIATPPRVRAVGLERRTTTSGREKHARST